MNCQFVKTIFKSSETDFYINLYKTGDKPALPAALAQTPDPLVTFAAKGYLLPTHDRLCYELAGIWENSEKYGFQLNVTSFREILPDTREGAVAYLASGAIKGIGPKLAERIADHFDPDTFHVLDHQPERLLEVSGISPNKLTEIRQSLAESHGMRNLITLLAPYGVTANKISRIYQHFGPGAYETIQKRPYKLWVINGFGYKTIDRIAKALGASPTDPLRLSGALHYVLEEAAAAGHLFLPSESFLARVHDLLNDGFVQDVVGLAAIFERLQHEVKLRDLVSDDQRVYLKRHFQAETTVAKRIADICANTVAALGNIQALQREIAISENRFGLTLADGQRQAVMNALLYPLSIITGSPGTGKTTILKIILDVKKRLQPSAEILLAAPTGRAARRMAEATGFPAATLHCALGLLPEEAEHSLDIFADLLICDEFSMCDMQLAGSLFSALPDSCQVVIAGDGDQLPSVGAGNVLRELIHSEAIPTTFLNQIFRQAHQSPIPYNAQMINQGSPVLYYNEDFTFIPVSASEAAAQIPELYLQYAARYGVDQVQVLSCMKNRGEACTAKLNTKIQGHIHAKDAGTPSVKTGSSLYNVGDKVIHKKNSLMVNNGDIGTIVDIYPDPSTKETVIMVSYSQGRLKEYRKEDYGQLELAYALTVHKAQGSECAVIIIPVLNEQYIMLKRNLIYTAVTRAKAKVILIGEASALAYAIKQNDVDDRNTLLAERIKQHDPLVNQ